MGVRLRIVLVLVAVACGTVLLHSFTHMHDMLVAGVAATYPAELNAATLKLLQDFPNSARALERRILSLETAILEASHGVDAVHALQTTLDPQLLKGEQAGSSGEGSDHSTLRWRQDHRCGKGFPEAKLVACDPAGTHPCCSPLGWCGHTDEHCKCSGCVDYRMSATSEPQEGKTVLVVIPFRDREGHLVNFKKYWRWFAKEGRKPRRVTRWEIFVVEQFDSAAFNRGWNFNVGLAIASAQTAASPEIKSEMKLDFDCAVIQDIDYLPEEGVDYAECEVPMQLSSEIDRYHWKTPYVQSAGGIVSMSLKHWRQINGFGNNYFGWGGEDDELFHRLRLNGLLFGDCYPFCSKKDPHKGHPGKSIKRPPKGFGRFSGKYMHSANHTKRITDSGAYARNVQMLEEIAKNGERWKTDGLSSLEFHMVGQETDRTDSSEYGITYRHIRVRRGKSPFDLSRIPLGVPASICSGVSVAEGWKMHDLHTGGIPWDLPALRGRLAALAEPGGGACTGASQASFLLLDRRRHFAKILASDEPRLLLVFYRSLADPAQDGLIIAEPRSKGVLREAFVGAGAFLALAADYIVCSANLKDGAKYSVHKGPACAGGGGWATLQGGSFRGFVKPRKGLQAVTFCDNTKYWTQHMVDSDQCPEKWAGLKWEHGQTFWVPRGRSFCVGTRLSDKQDLSFSRLLPQERCDGDGFVHAFNFKSVEEEQSPPSLTVCIGLVDGGLHVEEGTACQAEEPLARFAARSATVATKADRLFCVASGRAGDEISEARKCGPKQKFVFAVPREPRVQEGLPAEAQRLPVCISQTARAQKATAGAECKASSPSVLRFEAPSSLDLVTSTPGTGGDGVPLYTLLEDAA